MIILNAANKKYASINNAKWDVPMTIIVKREKNVSKILVLILAK